MTKEIKNKLLHYYVDDAGRIHGEYKTYWENGKLWTNGHFKNGECHGEYKSYWDDGQLEHHAYYVNDAEVHGFIKDGDSEFIRTCLYMTHGAPWLGDTDAT